LVFVIFALIGGPVQSQTQDDPGTEDNYQSDVRPGLHFNNESETTSMLARAARAGVSVVISEDGTGSNVVQQSKVEKYTVKEGDTLWDICIKFFGDPYVWPRIWSYNIKVTNPHWIYPGDTVWLVPPVAIPMSSSQAMSTPQMVQQRANSAVLIRNKGFVDRETLKKAGVLVGAQKETMMLAEYDEAYAEFEYPDDIHVGDEFAAYKVIRSVDSIEDPGSEMGKLVEILGTVRVVHFDKSKGIARVVIDESMKPIVRGTRIGPVERKFELVSKTVNQQELRGHVIAFLDLNVLSAAGNVVFVDKGREQGVIEGNRFFVIEKRDRYRASNNEPDDRDGYPFEVLAELRVIEARPNTSTCLVMATVKELEVGAVVEMVRGY